ncbi:MAG: glycine cleavage system protein GcvH [Proteobacteria bacterium]|nr:glycine cleavage system protein GcvH [Pseudomonadota bacterium]
MYPEDLKYSEEHEWVRVDGNTVTVGITDFAQDALGDIVDMELPDAGASVTYMKECGAIESVKTASDLFSPVTGRVTERNESLLSRIDGKKNAEFHPEWVNQDPYGKGWLFKVEITDGGALDKLMSSADYAKHVG